MAEDFEGEQRELAQLWKKARKGGRVPPRQQAKVFGSKEAWREMHGDFKCGLAPWTTERAHARGRPRKRPSEESVRQLMQRMDDDEDLPPGKVRGSLGGGALPDSRDQQERDGQGRHGFEKPRRRARLFSSGRSVPERVHQPNRWGASFEAGRA